MALDLPPPYAPGGATARTVIVSGAAGPAPLHLFEVPGSSPLWSVAPTFPVEGLHASGTVDRTARRRSPAGAFRAAINADFFAFGASGEPSGGLVTGGVLHSEALSYRSTAVSVANQLFVARVGFKGSYQSSASAQARTLDGINRQPRDDRGEAILFTPAWGTQTPPLPASAIGVEISELVPPPPTGTVTGIATGRRFGGTMPIPANGAVLVATRDRAATLRTAGIDGASMAITTASDGLPEPADWAVGGGPLIVRAGAAVPVAGEGFTSAQLNSAVARTAIGRTRDGRWLFAVVDGGRTGQGYGPGLTNAEFSRAVAAQGVDEAMALDGGGSSELNVDGFAVNRPTGGRSRAVGPILLARYAGAWLPPPSSRLIRPGFADARGHARLVANAAGAGRMFLRIVDDRGRPVVVRQAAFSDVGGRPLVLEWAGTRAGRPVPNGAYRAEASFGPSDPGVPPTLADQSLIVARVLGPARRFGAGVVVRARAPGRPARTLRRVRIGFRVQATSRLTVVARGPATRVLADLTARPGTRAVIFDGRTPGGRALPPGVYRIVVSAKAGSLPVVRSEARVGLTLRRPPKPRRPRP